MSLFGVSTQALFCWSLQTPFEGTAVLVVSHLPIRIMDVKIEYRLGCVSMFSLLQVSLGKDGCL